MRSRYLQLNYNHDWWMGQLLCALHSTPSLVLGNNRYCICNKRALVSFNNVRTFPFLLTCFVTVSRFCCVTISVKLWFRFRCEQYHHFFPGWEEAFQDYEQSKEADCLLVPAVNNCTAGDVLLMRLSHSYMYTVASFVQLTLIEERVEMRVMLVRWIGPISWR